MTNGYPIFEWVPGTLIDGEDCVQYVIDTTQGGFQVTADTFYQEYQDGKET